MSLKGSLTVASDKSITHRAIIFSSLVYDDGKCLPPLVAEQNCVPNLPQELPGRQRGRNRGPARRPLQAGLFEGPGGGHPLALPGLSLSHGGPGV